MKPSVIAVNGFEAKAVSAFHKRWQRSTRRAMTQDDAFVLGASWARRQFQSVSRRRAQRAYLIGLKRGYRLGGGQ